MGPEAEGRDGSTSIGIAIAFSYMHGFALSVERPSVFSAHLNVRKEKVGFLVVCAWVYCVGVDVSKRRSNEFYVFCIVFE